MTDPVINYGLPFGACLEMVKFNPSATTPTRAYSRSAAYDIAACTNQKTITIAPQTTKKIPTGLGFHPPYGHCIQVCSRSGITDKSVFVANAPGIVDPDFTGEIQVLLYNGGVSPFYVRDGDRIAQILVIPFASLNIREVGAMPITERGERGFGSTGV